ncbi:MAG: hypothetical protein JRN35_06025 [Nitrososphaerota archaeon]|nr:hypothetical protein [Nitrososphaerota archaeon]
MTKSNVVKVGYREYEKLSKEFQDNPVAYKADEEYKERVKAIFDKHEADVKKLNDEFTGHSKSSVAYHERSRINSRNYEVSLLKLQQEIFSKYGLGDVPVTSDTDYRYWLEAHDPRTKSVDNLEIRASKLSTDFMNAVRTDIDNAEKQGIKLRYDKEGEFDGFSAKTKNLYSEMQKVERRLRTLKTDYPREAVVSASTLGKTELIREILKRTNLKEGSDAYKENAKALAVLHTYELRGTLEDLAKNGEASLQSVESSRSARSRESDERQSNSLTVSPDDPRTKRWKRDPGSMDVEGIDTPKTKYKPVTKKRKSHRHNPPQAGLGRTRGGR